MTVAIAGESLLHRITATLDVPARWAGKLVAWLVFPMMGALVFEVLSRYVLNAPTVWAYDVTYMLYATIFMLGAPYALGTDAHVRADFLYNDTRLSAGTIAAGSPPLPTSDTSAYLGRSIHAKYA